MFDNMFFSICFFRPKFTDSGLAMSSNVVRQSITNETELIHCARNQAKVVSSSIVCCREVCFLNSVAIIVAFICGPNE